MLPTSAKDQDTSDSIASHLLIEALAGLVFGTIRPRHESPGKPPRHLLAASLLLFAALVAAPNQAQAQTVTLVSNLGKTGTNATTSMAGQPFTTGMNAAGYSLTEVTLKLNGGSGTDIWVQIYTTATEGPSTPDTKVGGRLTNPASIGAGDVTFTTSGVTLQPDTRYAVVVSNADEDEGPGGGISLRRTTENGEGTKSVGWSIADRMFLRNNDGEAWAPTQGTNSTVLRMRLKGTILNTPATGQPTISGTAQVGQTLTAGQGTIADVDGLPTTFPDDYTFQWIQVDGSDETDISGATSSTYTLVADDEGKTVKVEVSFTDDTGDSEELTSAAYPSLGTISGASNAAATGQPTISGTAQVGQTLTAGQGMIADSDGLPTTFPDDYTFQWIRVDGSNETDISGATSSTYTLVADDEGKKVKVKVSFTDDAGYSEELTSADYPSSGMITSASNTPATGRPTISGTAEVGQTLTASTSGIADADGLTSPGWTYQWILVDGGTETNIAGATSSTYTLVADDAGKKVKVKVSFTDDASYSEEKTSVAYPLSGTIAGGREPDEPLGPVPQRSVQVPQRSVQVLRAYFRDVPAGHDGTTAFTVLIAFSERVKMTEEQLLQALTVTGGTVTSAQEVSGLGDRWLITVTPNSDDAVLISLPKTTSCSAAGAICSSNDSKKLVAGISASIPRAPLTARFAEVPTGHIGVSFTLHLAFSEAVATTATTLGQALTVTGGTITTTQQVDDRRDLWEVTLTPSGNDAVRLSLPPTTACADDNAVCTADGLMLSAGIAASVARTPLTAGFAEVPEGHHGVPFTLHLAFSEPVATTATALERALTVTGGTINTIQPVDDRSDLWEIQLQPNDADVSISLSKTTACADEGAVCTQSDLAQQNDAQASISFSGYLMPHALDKVSGEDQTGPANTQLADSFVVVASDEEGAALAGVIVTFTVSGGGGMLSANTDADPCTFESSQTSITAITDANGQAATRLTLGSESGTNTVDISVAGLEPEPFTATATEQATPQTLATVCGEDQEGTVGELLAQPFVVFVSDEEGAAMAGVAVSFAVTAGGGTMSATVNTTNADGYARTWLTLGSELGTNTVTATVEGLDPVTFTATGQESPLASLFDAFMSGKLVALPDSPQLAQNAPNPFNSQTVLAYFLPAARPVRLEVFSLTGQRVAVLRHGLQQAGFHQLRWDGRDDAGRSVASGLYLYRLVTGDAVLTRKLMLLR